MDKFVKELFTDQTKEQVVVLYGIGLSQLYSVGGFENFVYGFDQDYQSYIVRVSHSSHRTLEEVQAEMDFLFYLAKNEARVSMPIQTVHGSLVERIDCEDGSYFVICAFTKAEGEVPSRKNASDIMFYNYGKTIGSFHRLTKNYRESKGITKRFTWDQDQLIVNAAKYLRDEDKFVLDRLEEVLADIRKIKTSSENFGLIHTDIHMGNFFVKEDELTVFDFDDCCYHYFASDIAIALFYLIFMAPKAEQHGLADRLMKPFMKGYLSENRLPVEDYLSIPKFLKLREFVLYLVFYKTVDVEESKFAKAYIERYRHRIMNRTPFIEFDFMEYYEQ